MYLTNILTPSAGHSEKYNNKCTWQYGTIIGQALVSISKSIPHVFQVAGVILLGQFLHSLRMRHLGAIPEAGNVTAKQGLEGQAAINVC